MIPKFLNVRASCVRGFLHILALFFFCVSGVFGQEKPGKETVHINPQDAVEMAIKNNLSLESARISLDTKQRKADLVWNQFLPSVGVTGTLSRDNRATTQQGFDFAAFTPYSITLPQWHIFGNFSATLDFSFALIEGIKSVKMDYQTGFLSMDKARLQLERDVRKTYNQILLLEKNAELLSESYANAKRQAASAEANFRAGLAPRLIWLQAQVSVENMRPTINEMENSIKALRGSFAMSLGLPYDTPLALEAFPPGGFNIPFDLAELISKAVSGKPDLMELRQSIATLKSARKAQAMQTYTPFLRFGWTLSSTFFRDPFKDELFNTNNWIKGGNFSITLGMNFNGLFSFTKEGQAIKDADNRIRELNVAMTQAIMGTELEVFTKLNSLEKTRSTEEAQKAAVELAELSYKLTEEAYRAGLQDFQQVQSAALALDQARLQLLTQQFNYYNDLIDLEYAVGVPFGTMSSFGNKQE
ncbi:MAG: TolC family protein [Treponema sp.]|jgi:outer membrane protein TolC|nr:TolC family protein [Treponema sp.]